MNATIILAVFVFYTVLLFVISHFTARKSDNNAFFRGNKSSPWFVVAYGMIGASLSGVTFMSVPGGVYTGQFTYLPPQHQGAPSRWSTRSPVPACFELEDARWKGARATTGRPVRRLQ